MPRGVYAAKSNSSNWRGVESCPAVIIVVWCVWAATAAVAAATVLYDKVTPEGPPSQRAAYSGLTTQRLRERAEVAMALMVLDVFLWSLAFSMFVQTVTMLVLVIHIFLYFGFTFTYMRLLAAIYENRCKGICIGSTVLLTPWCFIALGNFGWVLGFSFYIVPVSWVHFQMKRKALISHQQALHPVEGVQIELAAHVPSMVHVPGQAHPYARMATTAQGEGTEGTTFEPTAADAAANPLPTFSSAATVVNAAVAGLGASIKEEEAGHQLTASSGGGSGGGGGV